MHRLSYQSSDSEISDPKLRDFVGVSGHTFKASPSSGWDLSRKGWAHLCSDTRRAFWYRELDNLKTRLSRLCWSRSIRNSIATPGHIFFFPLEFLWWKDFPQDPLVPSRVLRDRVYRVYYRSVVETQDIIFEHFKVMSDRPTAQYQARAPAPSSACSSKPKFLLKRPLAHIYKKLHSPFHFLRTIETSPLPPSTRVLRSRSIVFTPPR